MNMTSIVKYVLVLCVLFVAGYTNAQITINTNFSVLSNQPIDSRDTLTTLADTSSVTWTFPGLLSYVVDIDEFWYYTGTQWRKLFDGTTIPSTVPDSLIVYAPAHGLSDTIALYGYVPVKADFTRANSTSIDSVFIAYAIDAPDTDSLTLIFSGVLTYGSWHGKEINTQYYLQDDGSEDTTPGTISIPTAIASDSLTLFLREVGADIAGRLRRIAMPSPLITAFGGNPASPTDAVVQAAIEGTYLPAGLAQPGTVFTLSYATQSYNPTYQQTAPNTNPLTPSYAWLWDGAYATRIVNIPTSVNLQDTSYGVLGTLVLLPIDSLMAASVPTDTEVALWLDTNYTANNLRLANGSLLYFLGDSTRQNPEYIWQVIDDISFDAGDTDWEKILKRIKSPVVGSINSIYNLLPNQNVTIDPNTYDLQIGTAALNNSGEFEFYALTMDAEVQDAFIYAGSRDSSTVATGEGFFFNAMIGAVGAEDGIIGVNYEYFGTVWNAAVFGDSMLFAPYPGSELNMTINGLPDDPVNPYKVMVQDTVTDRVYLTSIDSLLGSGTAGTLPIWNADGTLGNSSLTEASGVLSSSLTGAFGLATGTNAQRPVGANGLMRYNSTGNGVEAWNGSAAAWRYLPWASAPAFSANVIPASNGANLVERDIYYNGTNMTVNEAAQTVYNLGVYGTAGARFSPTTSDDTPSVIINTGTTSPTSATLTVRGQFSGHAGISMQDNSIIYFPGSGSYRAESYSSANTAHMRIENDGAGMAVVLDETTVKKPTIAGDPAFFVGTFGTTGATVSQNIPLVRYMTGYSLNTPGTVSNQTYLQNGYGLYNEFLHSTSVTNHPIAARYGTEVVTVDSATYGAKMWFSSRAGNVLIRGLELYGNDVTLTQYGTGARTGTHAYSASYDSSGRLIEVPEKWGAISTSTDGSGDITVAHGMGVTPTVVDIQFTGTSGSATPYVYVVLTDGTDATNFTIRVFDMTGAAVTSTAVTATWHCKT